MRFAIFIYPGVEPIDLATFGVLSMARRVAPEIEVFTVAPSAGPVALSNGLVVIAQYGIDECPDSDVIIVTGGPGWEREASNAATLAFLRRLATERIVTSVCTGGMILAAAGILDGLRATTKREVIGSEVSPLTLLRARHPEVRAVEACVVDEGMVVTGGGVTLCIDTTLHLLERLLGNRVATETARIMEYTAARKANRQAFEPAKA